MDLDTWEFLEPGAEPAALADADRWRMRSAMPSASAAQALVHGSGSVAWLVRIEGASQTPTGGVLGERGLVRGCGDVRQLLLDFAFRTLTECATDAWCADPGLEQAFLMAWAATRGELRVAEAGAALVRHGRAGVTGVRVVEDVIYLVARAATNVADASGAQACQAAAMAAAWRAEADARKASGERRWLWQAAQRALRRLVRGRAGVDPRDWDWMKYDAWDRYDRAQAAAGAENVAARGHAWSAAWDESMRRSNAALEAAIRASFAACGPVGAGAPIAGR